MSEYSKRDPANVPQEVQSAMYKKLFGDGKTTTPPHPYWCDECGRKAPFAFRKCPIDHEEGCPRFGEDANAVWLAAYEYVRDTGKSIP